MLTWYLFGQGNQAAPYHAELETPHPHADFEENCTANPANNQAPRELTT